MFRLRCVNSVCRRLIHVGTFNRDQVLQQLQVCSAEDQVFDVVGKHKTRLTVGHVSQAVGMLWHFQMKKPDTLRAVEHLRNHPQFLTLRCLAENKIPLMDDVMLVDMLYIFLRFNVEKHDSLVQQLVSEAWRRIDGLSMASLSKFANCITDKQFRRSPLMGHIARIVDQKLSSIDDIRILSSLMVSLSSLISPRFRDALIVKAYQLLETTNPTDCNDLRRVVQFLRNIKYSHRPLLEKCNQVFLSQMSSLDVENITIIMGLYPALQFYCCDFRQAVKQRLLDLADSTDDPAAFIKLFITLAPMASYEIRQRLENTAVLKIDELTKHQALILVEALHQMGSRNLCLLKKTTSVIQRKLHAYTPIEVVRITNALVHLQYQGPELLSELRKSLANSLLGCVVPQDVAVLFCALSKLPCSQLDESVISWVDAVVPQCDLYSLLTMSSALAKWMRNNPSFCYNTRNKCIRLLQTMNRCGHKRLQTADLLDTVLEELKHAQGKWFEENMVDETMVSLQRMMDQINWKNVSNVAQLLWRMKHICPPLMDRIATVAIQDIDKIHHSAIYFIPLPFCVLNYDTPQVEELYSLCIQCVTPHISSIDPNRLIFLAYNLALANVFPEQLIREIFSVNFLRKLDTSENTLSETLKTRTRQHLMLLNRAVYLECPEFQVPWFHQYYHQEWEPKGTHILAAQHHIKEMLDEILGGSNYVQVVNVTPYGYITGFEFILDKDLQPLPYSKPKTLQISDRGKISSADTREELPPGAQRVAVELLGPKSFCKNSNHMRGEAVMRKRHLEILGYRMVLIPHFEWNSMELSSTDAWKEYLKTKIFKELSS